MTSGVHHNPVPEGEARRLLARAADTIQVNADAPLQLTGFPEPALRRRWPMVLAAAAAVVALVGGGLAAGLMLSRDGEAEPVGQDSATDPTTEPSVVPTATDAPVPPTPARRASADQFVRWARGTDPAPPFVDRVRNLSPGFAGAWNEQPERREYWSGCSGLGFPDCGIDPIASLLHDPADIVALAGRADCAGVLDPGGEESATMPPRFVTAEARADEVRLQPAGAGDCGKGTVINLWIHPDGEIYGVQLVLASTMTP